MRIKRQTYKLIGFTGEYHYIIGQWQPFTRFQNKTRIMPKACCFDCGKELEANGRGRWLCKNCNSTFEKGKK